MRIENTKSYKDARKAVSQIQLETGSLPPGDVEKITLIIAQRIQDSCMDSIHDSSIREELWKVLDSQNPL
jgi:hypothetical protein